MDFKSEILVILFVIFGICCLVCWLIILVLVFFGPILPTLGWYFGYFLGLILDFFWVGVYPVRG